MKVSLLSKKVSSGTLRKVVYDTGTPSFPLEGVSLTTQVFKPVRFYDINFFKSKVLMIVSPVIIVDKMNNSITTEEAKATDIEELLKRLSTSKEGLSTSEAIEEDIDLSKMVKNPDMKN